MVPLTSYTVKWTSFFSLYWAGLHGVHPECLRASCAWFVCECVCVFLLSAYICTVVCIAAWTLSCQCDPGLISPLVLNPRGRWTVTPVPSHSRGPSEKKKKITNGIRPISASVLALISVAIFRPAGYKAAGIGALAGPSALSNFADPGQFSFLGSFFLLLFVSFPALRNNIPKITEA